MKPDPTPEEAIARVLKQREYRRKYNRKPEAIAKRREYQRKPEVIARNREYQRKLVSGYAAAKKAGLVK